MLGWFGGLWIHRHDGILREYDAHSRAAGFLLAIAAEFFGGIGLVLGLLGRVAALGIAVNMVVAIMKVHMAERIIHELERASRKAKDSNSTFWYWL